jgi:ATP-dependent Clp protease adaptor protein ClpS
MPTGGLAIPGRTPESLQEEHRGSLWAVIIHNDDVTPMDFVIHVLESVFEFPRTNAMQVMYTAHLNGEAYVQTLPEGEARRRVGKARFAARMRRFPLEFSLVPQ